MSVLGRIGAVRSPARIRECTMLLSAVMFGRVGAQESPLAPDLHRVAGEGDLDLATFEGVADAVVGSREAHLAVVTDLADDDPVGGRPLRRRGERATQHARFL